MINKELLRKAAEDIDLFQDDLSREYDMIVRSRRSSSLKRWAVAACVVMTLGISLTLYIYNSPTMQPAITKSSQPTIARSVEPALPPSSASPLTDDHKLSYSQNAASASYTDVAQEQHTSQKACNENSSPALAATGNTSEGAEMKLASHQTATNHTTKRKHQVSTPLPSSANNSSQHTMNSSADLLLAILTEVETRSMAQQEKHELLQRAILEEINSNAVSKTNQIELSL